MGSKLSFEAFPLVDLTKKLICSFDKNVISLDAQIQQLKDAPSFHYDILITGSNGLKHVSFCSCYSSFIILV